ncbi:hypothetical protein PGT21_014636 [Puccinia graminis f. sp. tritici]|nr:hypothetical protein PGT21_014636 [Puccinia graminis f. sp. tritici]
MKLFTIAALALVLSVISIVNCTIIVCHRCKRQSAYEVASFRAPCGQELRPNSGQICQVERSKKRYVCRNDQCQLGVEVNCRQTAKTPVEERSVTKGCAHDRNIVVSDPLSIRPPVLFDFFPEKD